MARHIYERLAGHNEDKSRTCSHGERGAPIDGETSAWPAPILAAAARGLPRPTLSVRRFWPLRPTASSNAYARPRARATPKAACEPEREAAPLCRGHGGYAQCAPVQA